MNVTVVGGGYVGLISAVCFCEFGHNIYLVEDNEKRFESLKRGLSTTSELGVQSGLQKHIENGNIKVLNDVGEAVKDSEAMVICVATTFGDTDSDLTKLHEVIQDISLSLDSNRYTGIFIKTSVPVGTCTIIANNMRFMRPDLVSGKHYDVIANPGFLREGTAVHDFMNPNRVLIGFEKADLPKAKELTLKLYDTLVKLRAPFIFANFESIELIRAATIAFISTKMAFINEMAELCDRTGGNINAIIKGIALDQGIGYKAFQISPGFGGTTFPRNDRALLNSANCLGLDLKVLNGVLESNARRISTIKKRILSLIQDVNSTRKCAIFGLSFKPLTSDIRESASILVIKDLLKENIEVSVYDPVYTSKSSKIEKIPLEIRESKNFHLEDSAYDAANQGDLIVIMTNWSEFTSLDFNKISELMNKNPNKKPVILDYRNMFSKEDLPDFEYIAQGY